MSAYVVKELDQRTHIYRFSDTYIGSCVPYERKDILLRDGRLRYGEVSMPSGMLRCFEEIISNAADNMIRAREEGWTKLPEISVVVTDHDIVVINGGPAIPLHTQDGRAIPETIFGHLLTSSHYDDTERTSAGRNGYGGKLCNIYSTKFEIDLVNNKHGYRQSWSDNMLHHTVPTTSVTTEADRSKVAYTLDFKRFGLEAYSAIDQELMLRTAFDYSFSISAPIRLNGTLFKPISALQYLELLNPKRPIAHFISKDMSRAKQAVAEVAAVAWEGGGSISFVNGIRTAMGGMHVDAVWKRLSHLLSLIWPRFMSATLKSNILVIVAISTPGPEFRTQTKDFLVAPKITLKEIDQQHILPLVKDVELEDAVCHAKEKIPTSTKVVVETSELEHRTIMDAADATTNKGASTCVVMVVEGRSARGYAETLIKMLPGGHNKYGIFELRGKIINVNDENLLHKNAELLRFERMLALGTNGMAQRYNQIWILADADPDGRHITLLFTYFMIKAARRMIEQGRVFIYNSPQLRVKAGNAHQSFYDIESYTQWALLAPGAHSTIWMKGLGSSSKADVQRDAKKIMLTRFTVLRPLAPLEGLFTSGSEARKHLLDSDPSAFVYQPEVDVVDYIEAYYPDYARIANVRSIPGIDGFKRPQRQVAWATLCKWSPGGDAAKGLTKSTHVIRLEQFSGYVAELLNYHHTEKSLSHVVILLASIFYNNYPLMEPAGMYGDLSDGMAAAAAPKYLNTGPGDLMRVLFNKDDVASYTKVKVDGMDCEPEILLPVIPYCLINGTQGTGVGCYTFIPPYNVHEIIHWFLERLNNLPAKEPLPWIRNYKGTVHVRNNPKGYRADESDDECEEGDKRWMETVGAWEVIAHKRNALDVLVTALPMRATLNEFILHLKRLMANHVISGYKNDTADTVRIKVLGLVMRNALYKRQNDKDFPRNYADIPRVLKLKKCFSLERHYISDANGRTTHMKSVKDILERFYVLRLPYYTLRKDITTRFIEEKLGKIRTKIAFIQSIVDGRVKVFDVPEEDVIKYMKENNIPLELYTNAKLRQFNQEQVAKSNEELSALLVELAVHEQLDAKGLWRNDLLRLRLFFTDGTT